MAGLGAVGARAARQAHTAFPAEEIVLVSSGVDRAQQVKAALAARARTATWDDALSSAPEAVILCGPAQLVRAEAAIGAGAHVVCTSGSVEDVEGLLALDGPARARERTLVVGAAFSPGLSCVLVRHAAGTGVDGVEEIRVASVGAGGPSCSGVARAAIGHTGQEWDAAEGGWVSADPGTGRELCWFPEPVSARDCYRGALTEPLLLHRAFPSVARISARRAASRMELSLARAPAPLGGVVRALPHPGLPGRRRADREGDIGALRVDVMGGTGSKGLAAGVRVLGAIDRPAVTAGAVAALAARWAVDGRFTPGAAGLASLVEDTAAFLSHLAERGIRAATLG